MRAQVPSRVQLVRYRYVDARINKRFAVPLGGLRTKYGIVLASSL